MSDKDQLRKQLKDTTFSLVVNTVLIFIWSALTIDEFLNLFKSNPGEQLTPTVIMILSIIITVISLCQAIASKKRLTKLHDDLCKDESNP